LLRLGQKKDVPSFALDIAGALEPVIALAACLAGEEDWQRNQLGHEEMLWLGSAGFV
jgi:hypothetical protein